nr:TPRXL isoform X1 [Ipomoea batatas]
MISDSIPKASIPMASSNPKDLAKKKRSHRSAKLKQYKLDARREQWLSQGGTYGSVKGVDERPRSIEKLEIIPRGEEDNEGSVNNYSDLDSPANSPTNHPSIVLGGNDSGTNFSGSSGSSSSSSTSSSGQCWSGSMSEEDGEGNDGCLDDWETIADALASIDENHGSQHNSSLDSNHGRNESVVQSSSQAKLLGVDNSKANLETSRPPANCRAWRPDDAFRPQSLPNLSKQYSFPMNSERHYRGGLCLFCHKRILEEDGRCPGCRKQYHCDPDEGEAAVDSGSPAIRLSRSCSMISRS